jgi:hypothetical protein
MTISGMRCIIDTSREYGGGPPGHPRQISLSEVIIMHYGRIAAVVAFGILLVSATAWAGGGPDSLWMRTYHRGNFEAGWSVQELSTGGFIAVGRTQQLPDGNPDVYILRMDGNGDTLWTRKYGWPLIDEPNQVRETSDGNYIVVGKTQAVLDSTYYMLVLKVAPDGDTLWTRTYGQGYQYSYGLCVEEVSTGGYILAGGCGTYAKSAEAFLIRTDSDGDTLWTSLYGTISQEEIWSIQETHDSGFIAGGCTSQDVYLLRTDANGDSLWTRQYGGPSSEMGLSVKETPDSGYILAGSTWSYGSGMSDAYYVKTDRDGDLVWQKTYGGTERDQVNTVVVTTDSHYVSAGLTESFGPLAANMWLVKMDADGDTVWTATYGGNGDDRAYWGEETSDGGFILIGSTNSFGAPQHNVYLVKTRQDESGVSEGTPATKAEYGLRALPVPSASDVILEFNMPATQAVKVAIYNLRGQELRVLARQIFEAGANQVTWDRADRYGHRVPSGMYFVRLTTTRGSETCKAVVME